MSFVDKRSKEERRKALNKKIVKKLREASRNRGKIVDRVELKI